MQYVMKPQYFVFITDDMAEKMQREVVLHDIDPAALQLLVDYSYTGEIHITEENVQVGQIRLLLV